MSRGMAPGLSKQFPFNWLGVWTLGQLGYQIGNFKVGQWFSRWWFLIIFSFHPYLSKIPISTNLFLEMGWFNHQLDATSNPPTGLFFFLQPQTTLAEDFSCTLRSPRWSNREVKTGRGGGFVAGFCGGFFRGSQQIHLGAVVGRCGGNSIFKMGGDWSDGIERWWKMFPRKLFGNM